MSTSPRPMAKILALWLEPSPSGRRCTRQCTTRTPAVRAAGSSRSMLGSAYAACLLGEHRQPGVGADDGALALLGDDRGVPGRRELGEVDASCRRDRVVAGHLVELCRPLPQCHIPFRVDLGQRRMFHVLLVAPDLQIIEDGRQELLFDLLAQLVGRDVGGVAGKPGPPDRVEQVRALVVDRRAGEDQPMVLSDPRRR